MIRDLESLRAAWPQNLALQASTPATLAALSDSERERWLTCITSGVVQPDSRVGCYAVATDDYALLKQQFLPVAEGLHGPAKAIHPSNWAVGNLPILPVNGIRLRLARNLAGWPFQAALSRQERLKLEALCKQAFEELEIAGQYEPAATHFFPDVLGDPYLVAAGIAGDWPKGRGIFRADVGKMQVRVGEEDHLRLIVRGAPNQIPELIEQLREVEVKLAASLGFARTNPFGYLASCPSNLGTGLRASYQLHLPQLFASGRLFDLARTNGLAVRSCHGEHQTIGSDGLVDLSPRQRLWITEGEIIARLHAGVDAMLAIEREA